MAGLSWLTGDAGGVSNKGRNTVWDLMNQIGAMKDQYNPQADVAAGLEAFDTSMRSTGAAEGRNVKGRGFRGNATTDNRRAAFAGSTMLAAQQKKRDWTARILSMQEGMLPSILNIENKPAKGGLLSAGASLFGDWLSGGAPKF